MCKFNKNYKLIEQYIENAALSSKIMSVYPETISRRLGISIDLVVDEMIGIVNKGYVQVKYEIRCVESLDVIEEVDDYRPLINKELDCTICGKNEIISYSNIYLKYVINKEYRDFIKENHSPRQFEK